MPAADLKLRVATCSQMPRQDVDEPVLFEALRAAGIEAERCAWDDAAVDWQQPVPTLVRSTWNYIHHLPAFLQWTEQVERHAPLWNPAEVVAQNCRKDYLLRLQADGVPIIPTRMDVAEKPLDLASLFAAAEAESWVVKPLVSAGSFGTRCFAKQELAEAAEHLAALRARGGALVQPYMASVESYGERSLVWIDGEITHAVHKARRLAGDALVIRGPVPVADDERALALAVLRPWASRLVYARVDLVRDADDKPRLMELELIEPALFLQVYPPAAERLASAVAARLQAHAAASRTTA